jgi:serine/threonine protein phosphatase PrpC
MSVVSVCSKAGAHGNTAKVNQDVVLTAGGRAVCLCDGHGEHGEKVAAMVAETLIKNLVCLLPDKDSAEAAQRRLRNERLNMSQYSGCTGVWATVNEERKILTVGNVGDSRCLVLDASFKLIFETTDHKPNEPKEAERIAKAGARVTHRPGDVPRVAGLALSRAFGDFAATRAGVIAVPDVQEIRLEDGVRWVFLASDGVFDVMDSEELKTNLARIRGAITIEEVISDIVNICSDRWQHDTDGQYRDDISCALWALRCTDDPGLARSKM